VPEMGLSFARAYRVAQVVASRTANSVTVVYNYSKLDLCTELGETSALNDRNPYDSH
jgi:hypothetical protein